MILPSLVAVITGHMARTLILKNPLSGGAELALTGLILGYIGLLYFLIVLMLMVVALIFAGLTVTAFLLLLGTWMPHVFDSITNTLP